MITKDSHPKSFELYKQYIKSQTIKNSTKQLPDELVDNLITDNVIAIALGKSTRDLYDYLDTQGIVVSVWDQGEGWRYRVADAFPMKGSASSRKEAEDLAFTEAFNRLERK